MQPYETYEPLLNSFYNAISKPELNKDVSSLFVPNVFDRYYQTNKKIFYIGRDTNEWGNLQQDFSNWNNHDILNNTKDLLESFKFIFSYNGERKGTFWDVVTRLHLKLKGKDVTKYSLTKIQEEFEDCFDFGYGNTNAIETRETLKRVNSDFDFTAYNTIKTASLPFDKLKNIVDAFQPKLVIVMHWAIDESLYLEGYNYEYLKDGGMMNEKFLCIRLNDTNNTHVVWISHPNYLKFYYDADEIINSLADFINANNLL